MNPSLDNEIREKLVIYLVEEISLEDFEDWFVSASWNVSQSKNQAAINMVYEIELRLAEYSDGFRSEDELKNYLRPLVTDYKVEIGNDQNIKMDSIAKVDWYQLLSVSFDI
jgi:hypothetical protein